MFQQHAEIRPNETRDTNQIPENRRVKVAYSNHCTDGDDFDDVKSNNASEDKANDVESNDNDFDYVNDIIDVKYVDHFRNLTWIWLFDFFYVREVTVDSKLTLDTQNNQKCSSIKVVRRHGTVSVCKSTLYMHQQLRRYVLTNVCIVSILKSCR